MSTKNEVNGTYPLDFITSPDADTAKDTFVEITAEEGV
jgi:hypothetical protein